MLVMTDRSFKVRSGKIIKAIKALDTRTFTSVAKVQDAIDKIVAKYFTSDQFRRFMRSEYKDQYVKATVALMASVIESIDSYEDKPTATTATPSRTSKPKKISLPKTGPERLPKVRSSKKLPRRPKILESAPPVAEKPTRSAPSAEKVDIVFSFDDTGSMSACRHITRQLVDEISADLLVEFGDKLNVGVVIHGDYCDPGDPVVSLPMTKDWVAIKRFLNAPRDFMGGDAPECYELVLHQVQEFDWRTKSQKILVLIGDEVPHESSYHENRLRLDWKKETNKLADMGVQIVSVQALDRRHANNFYATIANMTGGHHLRLTQLNQTAELLRAICYNSCGQLSKYESTLSKRSSGSSAAFKRNLDVLAGRTTKVELVEGLSEFQMFEIGEDDHDIRIRDYVEKMGMKFRTGCGYYEFMKPELVQDYKKVVVQDRETEVFYPDVEGRKLLRLPSFGTVRINPKHYDSKYRFFIQSTSYTRKLKAGTTFLYDNR